MGLTRPRYSQIYDTDYKQSVRVATTVNIANLAGGAPSTVDTIALVANDRILVKDQSTAAQNGIYSVLTVGTGSNGTWTRALDADASDKVTSGMTVIVSTGATNATKTFRLSTLDPITLGTTALTFVNPYAGTATPGGANTQVQFNDVSQLGGSTAFTFDKFSNVLTVSGNISSTNITGTIQTAAQPIITSVGTLTSLAVGNVTTSGNLIFSNSGQRIIGDFSNAVQSERVMVQTSTANASTRFSLLPNGTATQSSFDFYNNSDAGNASVGVFTCNATEVRFNSAATGTGNVVPMTFYTNGTEKLRINTAGELGIAGANYGTSGQVLTSGGTGASPSWASPRVAPLFQSVFAAGMYLVAGTVAGTYYGLANGGPGYVSGSTGAANTVVLHYIRATDFPTLNGQTAKLRVTVTLSVNDVAPTGNYTIGLYPVTRPTTSGGAAVQIYTLGTVVSGSTVAFVTPAADSMTTTVSTTFALPADGVYTIGVVSTATVATSSIVDMWATVHCTYS